MPKSKKLRNTLKFMLAMERKIGEIFEFGGEWLQCVEQPKKYDKTVCAICDFQGNGNCELDRCSETYRSDKKSVIFKKLEKVGEPYEFDGHLFQSYRTFEVPIFTENYATVRELGNNSKISIEIKQTKEDMEEKKLNLKPFDIQKAREGKPVCTRDGRKARIICFDVKAKKPIAALITNDDTEEAHFYYDNGRSDQYQEYRYDLMMLPEKKEGWININKDTGLFKSREEAERYCTKDYAPVRIEFEI